MQVIYRSREASPACSYLPDRQSTLEYEIAVELSPEEYEDRMNAGWRKFGLILFHPVCATCRECRPIRVPVADFRPDRSQVRAWKRNADLRIEVGPPRIDPDRLDLYDRYHLSQASRKGWEAHATSPDDYHFRFVQSVVPGLEISIRQGDQLCAVALTEVTPTAVSAIYHYHEPSLSARSLGTFAILQIVELARRLGKTYVYLGYYVAGCASMEYKTRYRPAEILGPDGVWLRSG